MLNTELVQLRDIARKKADSLWPRYSDKKKDWRIILLNRKASYVFWTKIQNDAADEIWYRNYCHGAGEEIAQREYSKYYQSRNIVLSNLKIMLHKLRIANAG
jgi:hypothetical protein